MLNNAQIEEGLVWDDSCWVYLDEKAVQVVVKATTPDSAEIWLNNEIIANGRLEFRRIKESGYPMRQVVFTPIDGMVRNEFELTRERIG